MTEEQQPKYSFKSSAWLILFVFYLQFLSGELLNMLWKHYFESSVPNLLAITCTQLFAVVLPCAVFLLLKGARPSEVIKFKKMRASTVVLCLITGAAAQPITSVINIPSLIYIQNKTGGMPAPTVNTPDGFTELLLTFLAAAVLPAVCEELLVRGVVLHSLEKRGYRASLLITALMFAVLHNDFSSLFGLFFFGIVLCYCVWMTQSVYAGMLVHLSFNTCAMLLDKFVYSSHTDTLSYIILLVICCVIFWLGVSALHRRLVRRYKSYGLFKQLFFSLFNFPIILVILGYIMFAAVK